MDSLFRNVITTDIASDATSTDRGNYYSFALGPSFLDGISNIYKVSIELGSGTNVSPTNVSCRLAIHQRENNNSILLCEHIKTSKNTVIVNNGNDKIVNFLFDNCVIDPYKITYFSFVKESIEDGLDTINCDVTLSSVDDCLFSNNTQRDNCAVNTRLKIYTKTDKSDIDELKIWNWNNNRPNLNKNYLPYVILTSSVLGASGSTRKQFIYFVHFEIYKSRTRASK